MQAAKVVELHPNAVPFTIPLDRLDSYEGIKLVGRLLRQWERKNVKQNTFKNMAKKVNLTPVTIARLASGETKAPRLHTLLAVLIGMGFVAARFE